MSPAATITTRLAALRARVIGLHESANGRSKLEAAEALRADVLELADRMRAVFWITGVDRADKKYVGRAYEEIWGRSRQELYRDPDAWFRAIHPEDRERVSAARDGLRPGDYDVQYRILRPDGAVRWIHDRGFPLPNEEGVIDRVAGIAEDITERRRAERALWHITESVAAVTGAEFFESLVTHIADCLDVSCVCVVERSEDGQVARPVACFLDGQTVETEPYPIHATPTGLIFENKVCIYPRDVRALYPDDPWLAAKDMTSYLGIPLLDTRGAVLGALIACDRSEVEELHLAETLFSVFAHRAGAELARARSEAMLRSTNEELEARVLQRTRALAEANTFVQQSEERYRVFVEQATEGIFCLEAAEPLQLDLPRDAQVEALKSTFQVIECNDIFARRVGRACAKDVIGVHLSELPEIWGADGDRLVEQLVDARFHLTDVETMLETPRGEVQFLRSNLVGRSEDSCVSRIWCIERDISDLKREEEALRASEAKNRSIIQTALDGITIVDLNGRMLEVNDALCGLTGYSREELTSLHIRELQAGLAGELEQAIAEIQESGSMWMMTALRRKSGESINVEISARFRDEHGGRLYCFIRDVTQRTQDEELQRQHLNELAHVARLSTMGEMASGIAHELNQPLSAIVNYTRGCVRRLRDATSDPELIHAMEEAAAQASRAGEIIRRMRNFVRKGDEQRIAIPMNQIVRGVKQLLTNEARRHDAAVDLELTDEWDIVLADPIQMEQVILNLARNGFEAMLDQPGDEPRTMTIRTSREANGRVRVSVSDTGPGVPEHAFNEVFAPFYTTKPEGMGMGLSISRSIIEAHGGSLWCIPRSGQGALFHLNLPPYEGDIGHDRGTEES